jgi:hypothetical protein
MTLCMVFFILMTVLKSDREYKKILLGSIITHFLDQFIVWITDPKAQHESFYYCRISDNKTYEFMFKQRDLGSTVSRDFGANYILLLEYPSNTTITLSITLRGEIKPLYKRKIIYNKN